jgi:hypothetical protein
MKIEKVFLKDFEKPQVIENPFPKFSKLQLTTIENKAKLLNPSVEEKSDYGEKSQTNEGLEQKVKESLAKLITPPEQKHVDSDDEEIGVDLNNHAITQTIPEIEYKVNSDDEEDIVELTSEKDNKQYKELLYTDINKIGELRNTEDFENSQNNQNENSQNTSQSNLQNTLQNTSQFSQPKYSMIQQPVQEEIEDEVEYSEEPDINLAKDIIDRRQDLLWSLKKFQLYQPNVVPSYNEFTSTEELEKILKNVKRESILKENINESKKYITFLWFGLEKVATQYLSIDLSGFTAHEAQHMDEYHKVLLELGERSYLNWSEGIPPEIKLIYIMLSHAGTFHIQKTTNVSNIFNIIKKGEMKGPTGFT